MTAAKRTEDLLKRPWSAAEDSLLARLWPKASWKELRAEFPDRTMSAMRGRAVVLGLRRTSNPGNTGNVVSPVIVREGVRGRACVKCLDWKPLEKFARHATSAEGRRNICTKCEGRAAYANNRERCIATVRKYRRDHPDRTRVHQVNAGARRRMRAGPHHGRHGLTVDDLRMLRVVYGDCCVYCGESAATIDHVVPLARGGEHVVGNLVPACSDCNRSKKDKLLSEWSGPRTKGA